MSILRRDRYSTFDNSLIAETRRFYALKAPIESVGAQHAAPAGTPPGMNGHARPYFEGHPTEVFDLAFDLICHPERGRFLADEGPAFAPVHGARLLELILNYPGVFV